jgi:PAS domain S-box-containing protein
MVEHVPPATLSAEHEMEVALRKSEERFRQVVEFAPSAMVMVDASGRICMVNIQAEKMFGYSRAELIGLPLETLVPERFRRSHTGLRATFYANASSRPMGAGRDLYAVRKDGSEIPVEIGLNPVETEEGTMVLSTILDISDRKQKEESIQAALNEKDVLLGEIHHRVKNNLQIVCSLLDLQSARIKDPAAAEMLRDSQNRVRTMALIHRTLYQSNDFARVDFANFLDSLAPTLVSSYGMGPSRVNLTIDAVEVLLPLNAAIPCGLVVNELISNALKHAFPQGRQGEISIRLAIEGDDTVILSVSDDGAGIPDHIDIAQADSLGLQLVSHLTDQLGGELSVHRRAPTRFLLRFPMQK